MTLLISKEEEKQQGKEKNTEKGEETKKYMYLYMTKEKAIKR